MASARRKGRGFEIRVSNGYDYDGRRIEKYMMWIPEQGMTKTQIERELERQKIMFEDKVKKGVYYDSRITFAKLAEIWMQDDAKNRIAPATYVRYQSLLDRINKAIGHTKIRDITPIHLNSFYSNLMKPNMKVNKYGTVIDDGKFTPSTVKKHHQLISSILSAAVKWGLVEQNVARRANIPKVPYREIEFLDADEIKTLISHLDNESIEFRTMILILVHTGMRRGELMGLEWHDINYDDSSIRIERSAQFIAGEHITKEPKSRKSIRVISINQTICQALREYKRWWNERRLMRGSDWIETDRLFTQWNGEPYFPDNLTQLFPKYLKRVGLKHVPLHSLRHSHATLMIGEDVDVVTVSKRLGHADTSITLNTYAHALKSKDRAAADKLDDLLSNIDITKGEGV